MKQVQITNKCGAVRVLPDNTSVPVDGTPVTVAASVAAHPVVAAWIEGGDLSLVPVAEAKGKKADKSAEIAAADAAVATAEAALSAAKTAVENAPDSATDADLDALAAAETKALANLDEARAARAAL